MGTSGIVFTVILSAMVILLWGMLWKMKGYTDSYILMGIDSIVVFIMARNGHATPFLVRKWCKTTDIPIRNEFGRYFADSATLYAWLKKNKKMLKPVK